MERAIEPIFVLTGPPAAGKSTVAHALLQRYQRGFHIPLDDLREWVVSGIAHPIPWSEETTRQFRLAEHAAMDIAVRYNNAGFAVAIDHCSGPAEFTEILNDRLQGRRVIKVALVPDLATNLARNSERKHKPFESETLVETIKALYPIFSDPSLEALGWSLIDTSDDTVQETVERLLALAPANGPE